MRFIYWRAKSIGRCLFLADFVIGKEKKKSAQMTFSSPFWEAEVVTRSFHS